MLRQQTTEDDAAAIEAMNRQRNSRMNVLERFSRRNVYSNGGGSGGPRTPRRSAPSSRHGATQAPVWGVRGSNVGGGEVQRPVEIDKPVRAY